MQKTIFVGSFKPPHKGHLYLVKKMLKMTKNGMVYIFISKKEKEPCRISGEVSRYIWKEYIETLPEKDKKRVRLIVSKLTSPIQTAYGTVKKIAKKGDIFYLVKSMKDASNSRFSSLIKIKDVTIKELILPGYEKLNATDMRKALKDNDKKKFNKFLPNKMLDSKKNNLWKKLKKLC